MYLNPLRQSLGIHDVNMLCFCLNYPEAWVNIGDNCYVSLPVFKYKEYQKQ